MAGTAVPVDVAMAGRGVGGTEVAVAAVSSALGVSRPPKGAHATNDSRTSVTTATQGYLRILYLLGSGSILVR
jgi:hypothetical protein